MIINSSLTDGEKNPLSIYQTGKGNEKWHPSEHGLVVASGAEYHDSVHTEAALFVETSERKTLNLEFAAEVKTEQDYDFLKVYVADQAGDHELISLSGDIPLKTYQFDLSQYVGSQLEIRFVFDSDEGVNAPGPRIEKLILR